MDEEYLNWLSNYVKNNYYLSSMELKYYENNEDIYNNILNISDLYNSIDFYAFRKNVFPNQNATTLFYIIKYKETIFKVGVISSVKPIYFCTLMIEKNPKYDFDYEQIIQDRKKEKKLTK